MEIGLLEYLTMQVAPASISDLKYSLKRQCIVPLFYVLEVEDFDLNEWNEAGRYLVDNYQDQLTREDARKELLTLLEAC